MNIKLIVLKNIVLINEIKYFLYLKNQSTSLVHDHGLILFIYASIFGIFTNKKIIFFVLPIFVKQQLEFL
jgi:hypothetical protein